MATKKKATQKKAPANEAKAKATPAQDNPHLSPRFWKTMWILCGTTVLLELFVHRHPHFVIEKGEPATLPDMSDSVLATMSNWFGFYGIYGLLACVGSVLLAKGLSVFLKVGEDYYDGTP